MATGFCVPMTASIGLPLAQLPVVSEKRPVFTPLAASSELLEELAEHSRRLDAAQPQEIIAWAVEKYFPQTDHGHGLWP